MSRSVLGPLLLVALVMLSALAVVYSKHESRRLFVELQHLQDERDRMDIDWGRLQLEESTWAAHGRVEETARTRLGMLSPAPDHWVILRP